MISRIRCFLYSCAGVIGKIKLLTIHQKFSDQTLVVMPDGIGEIINIGTYLPYYEKKNHKDIMIIVSNKRKAVTGFINYRQWKIYCIDNKLIKCIHALIFTKSGKAFIKKHDWFTYPMKSLEDIDYKKGFIWNIKDSMGIVECKEIRSPIYCNKQLSKTKTIYLNPYARTVDMVDFVFYEKLAERLKTNGFEVYTITGNDSQKAVAGTKAVKCNLQQAMELLSGSAGLIGVRSGFIDLAAGLPIPIICVYPKEYGWKDFCSLQYLEYKNNVQEYYIQIDNLEGQINVLMDIFLGGLDDKK